MDRFTNAPGTPPLEPDPAREDRARAILRGPAMRFDPAMRSVLEQTLREACAYRGWSVLALAVLSNHIHIVASAPLAPERVMAVLKARGTRALRVAGLVQPGAFVWSHHGSTRYLWTERDVTQAVTYVSEGQG